MNKVTLSSRHRIRNSSPDGLTPSTLPLGHGGSPQYLVLHVDGEETALSESESRNFATSKIIIINIFVSLCIVEDHRSDCAYGIC